MRKKKLSESVEKALIGISDEMFDAIKPIFEKKKEFSERFGLSGGEVDDMIEVSLYKILVGWIESLKDETLIAQRLMLYADLFVSSADTLLDKMEEQENPFLDLLRKQDDLDSLIKKVKKEDLN